MKKRYSLPNITVNVFDSNENILTASAAVDGVKLTESALGENGIDTMQSMSLDDLDFTY